MDFPEENRRSLNRQSHERYIKARYWKAAEPIVKRYEEELAPIKAEFEARGGKAGAPNIKALLAEFEPQIAPIRAKYDKELEPYRQARDEALAKS